MLRFHCVLPFIHLNTERIRREDTLENYVVSFVTLSSDNAFLCFHSYCLVTFIIGFKRINVNRHFHICYFHTTCFIVFCILFTNVTLFTFLFRFRLHLFSFCTIIVEDELTDRSEEIFMEGATIRDVAGAAGVSIATVSRALNTPDKVRPATLARIQKIMADMNYAQAELPVPAPAHNSFKMIGFIVSDLTNSHFTLMAKEIERALAAENYSLIVCNTDNNPQQERMHIEHLISLGVDGLIINTTSMNNEYIEQVSRTIPLVLVSRRLTDRFRGDYVGSNNAGGTEQLTRHLIDLGHRRIGMINANLRFSTGKERFDGFVKAMEGAHLQFDPSYVYTGSYFFEMGGVEGCQYLLSRSPRPTAIIIGNNSMALGAYKYLRSQNIDVPGDISIASFGDLDNHELFWQKPTIVTLSPAYIGQKAASCLLSRISNQDLPNREIIYEPSLIAAETTRSIYE